MKISALALSLVALALSSAHADDNNGLPNPKPVASIMETMSVGEYTGFGWWKSEDSHNGVYEVSTKVLPLSGLPGVQLDSKYRYQLPDGKFHEGEIIFSALDEKLNGFFDLVKYENDSAKTVGSGYCYGVQCHYTNPDHTAEETLSFVDGHLYRFGTKTEFGRKIVWQEALTRK